LKAIADYDLDAMTKIYQHIVDHPERKEYVRKETEEEIQLSLKRINERIESEEKREKFNETRGKIKNPRRLKLFSYIDGQTGDIHLHSFSSLRSGSEKWVISDRSVAIIATDSNGRDDIKTIPISSLSGVKLENTTKRYTASLRLYIGAGRTSSSLWGTGGASGLENYMINFKIPDLDIAQKAHDLITATPQTNPAQSVADDEITKLKALLDDGVLT